MPTGVEIEYSDITNSDALPVALGAEIGSPNLCNIRVDKVVHDEVVKVPVGPPAENPKKPEASDVTKVVGFKPQGPCRSREKVVSPGWSPRG